MSITRREFFVASSTAIAATALRDVLFAGQQAAAPAQPQAIATAFETVRGDVGYFTGRGGTIGWMVTKDAVAAVDTQYPNTAQICVDGLKQRSSGRTIDMTFITHHHGDHTGGLAIFQGASKKVLAHERVPELMKMVASAQPNAPAPVLPTATFGTVWSEEMGKQRITARHYGPGHTGGDAVIHFERAHVVHMGDLLFYEIHPRVDRPGGASIQNWMKTLETVAKEMPADTLYIAGHARPGAPVVVKRDALLGLRNYFDAALNHVRKGLAQQKAQADIVSLAALPGFEQYQSSGQILTLSGVLTAAYEELSQPRRP